jgi:hypothetical protein
METLARSTLRVVVGTARVAMFAWFSMLALWFLGAAIAPSLFVEPSRDIQLIGLCFAYLFAAAVPLGFMSNSDKKERA